MTTLEGAVEPSNNAWGAGGSKSQPHNPELTAAAQKLRGRRIRWSKEQNRGQEVLSTLLRANGRLINNGFDPIIAKLAENRDFGRYDLVIMRLLSGPHNFSIVGVPKRVWKDRGMRSALFELKLDAALMGIRVLLIPMSGIEQSHRFDISRALAAARTIRPTVAERQKIVEHVIKCGGSTLSKCVALVVGHPDPAGVVLSLCATQWLRLQTGGKALNPDTKILPVS